jgi:hypothetical protein
MRAALASSEVSKTLRDETTSVALASVRMTTVPSLPRRCIAACSMPPATVNQIGVPASQSRTFSENALTDAERGAAGASRGIAGVVFFGATFFDGARVRCGGFFARFFDFGTTFFAARRGATFLGFLDATGRETDLLGVFFVLLFLAAMIEPSARAVSPTASCSTTTNPAAWRKPGRTTRIAGKRARGGCEFGAAKMRAHMFGTLRARTDPTQSLGEGPQGWPRDLCRP